MRLPANGRVVVVRRETNYAHLRGLKIAYLAKQTARHATIHFRVGRHGYHPTPTRLARSCVLRDATPRERDLGYVVDQVVPAGAGS